MEEEFFTEEELRSLRETALEELRELALELAPLIEALIGNPEDASARARATSIFHTIKGSASMCGLKNASRIGADMETALGKFASDMPLSQELLLKINRAIAELESFIKSQNTI